MIIVIVCQCSTFRNKNDDKNDKENMVVACEKVKVYHFKDDQQKEDSYQSVTGVNTSFALAWKRKRNASNVNIHLIGKVI